MTIPHDPTDTVKDDRRLRLDAFIASRRHKPFEWGANDCCIFAADAVLATTGVDHAAELRGTYSDAASALAIVFRLGGIKAVASRAGKSIAPLMAIPGDIGLVEFEGRDLLAVCHGECWLAPTAYGLAALPYASARCAWRVDSA